MYNNNDNNNNNNNDDDDNIYIYNMICYTYYNVV